jgi:hypothetical protein
VNPYRRAFDNKQNPDNQQVVVGIGKRYIASLEARKMMDLAPHRLPEGF